MSPTGAELAHAASSVPKAGRSAGRSGSFNRAALSSSTTSITEVRSSSSSCAAGPQSDSTMVIANSPRETSYRFLQGPNGGHQIRNETDEVARALIVSSNARPDVAEYPETGKIGFAVEGADWEFHRRADATPHAGPE